MRRLVVLALASALTVVPASPEDTGPRDEETREEAAPAARFSGRVMVKDGVTPVAGAEVILSGAVEGDPYRARTDRRGRFRLRVPAGDYSLRIRNGMEIYRSASSYRVSAGLRNEIDFLLLPDLEPPVEHEKKEAPVRPIRSGPDASIETPVEVGTVVDVVRSAGAGRTRRWAELLGFLGSLLAVAAASR